MNKKILPPLRENVNVTRKGKIVHAPGQARGSIERRSRGRDGDSTKFCSIPFCVSNVIFYHARRISEGHEPKKGLETFFTLLARANLSRKKPSACQPSTPRFTPLFLSLPSLFSSPLPPSRLGLFFPTFYSPRKKY